MDLLNNIPNCELKGILIQKIQSQCETYADLYAKLQQVTSHISEELRQINELFPEYTPHDKDYHITHLFRISDILLGKNRYEQMNIMELYLLIVSMYAHDWGMAVSKSERYFIATGKMVNPDTLMNLLDDESVRFKEFIYLNFGKDSLENDEEIGLTYWQDYIRNTHALRSAKRIEKYFNKTNGSIASALAKISAGHWLNIEDISDRNGYYVDTSVFGETVNLKAITIYIRLIDLFDLAEDRTPYVIWKYINPQNAYSKMEWDKHRALHQITCPSYESGRVICISGSTDNHEVYAALMDFKNLCEKYFRECTDMLAHMNNPRYELGVYFLDWRIEARNFKPISIQFNFERSNIFEILGQEIYNCHPYVYIRELIQNSVDAIDLRREVLRRKKVGGDNIGYIHIDVKETPDNSIEIICKDDGVGMDQYILNNYFAVLGKSYYQSSDFKNKRINISPISKFGIGILSCFAITSQMEIYTAREPYMNEGRECLKVVINDIEKQFRIEEISNYDNEIGTKIVLKIKKEILEKHLRKNKMELKDFNITNYIKRIAGFVKYPIVINEKNEKTIILHTENNIEIINSVIENTEEYKLFSISLDYPVEKVVAMQDIDNFIRTFETKRYDIKSILKIEGLEGNITFSILKDCNDNILNQTHGWPAREINVRKETGQTYRIRWIDEYYRSIDEKRMQNINIYSKGFLLENESGNVNYRHRFRTDLFPSPVININFLNNIENISVSRFKDKDENHVLENVWNQIVDEISNELKEISKEKQGYDFWRILSLYSLQYFIDIEDLPNYIFENIKFPFINDVGNIVYDCIYNMQEIVTIPNSKSLILKKYYDCQDLEKERSDWHYGKCLIGGFGIEDRGYSMIINSITNNIDVCINNALKRSFYFNKIIITHENDLEYHNIQYLWVKKDKNNGIVNLISEILCDYSAEISEIEELYKYHRFVEFDDEHGSFFSYGFYFFNIYHPFTKNILQYIWMMNELKDRSDIDKLQWATINDLLDEFPLLDIPYDDKKKFNFNIINSNIEEIEKYLKNFYSKWNPNSIKISENDFIKNSINILEEQSFKIPRYITSSHQYYYDDEE